MQPKLHQHADSTIQSGIALPGRDQQVLIQSLPEVRSGFRPEETLIELGTQIVVPIDHILQLVLGVRTLRDRKDRRRHTRTHKDPLMALGLSCQPAASVKRRVVF